MSVKKQAYIINPDSGRSLRVGGKIYRKLVKEGKIKNEEFHKTPDNEVVRVINAEKPREINSLIKDDYLNKKSEKLIDTILEKYEKTLLNIHSDKLENKIKELIQKECENQHKDQHNNSESEFEFEKDDLYVDQDESEESNEEYSDSQEDCKSKYSYYSDE